MSTASGPDGARRHTAEHLREEIAEHRRELARTVTALHHKTDVPGRVREKASGAEIAVTDLARRAGRTAGAVPRFVHWAGSTASDGAHKVPERVRAPVERAAGLVRSRWRTFLAVSAALLAVLVLRRWRGR